MPSVLKPSQYKQQRSNISADASVIEQTNVLTMAEQMGKELIASAEKKAQLIVKAAQQEAAEIREKAKVDFDKAYENGLEAAQKEGFEEGYKNGYDEGCKAAKVKSDELNDDLITVIKKLESAKNTVIKQQKAKTPEIVTYIAGTVMSEIVEQHKELMCNLIDDCLKNSYDENHLNIYVSKDIYNLLNDSDSNFISQIKASGGSIKVLQNSELEDTDCIIEADDYISDISLNSQLEKIKAVLRK